MALDSKFSSVLQLQDLDDFITPSQECVRNVQVPRETFDNSTGGSPRIRIGFDSVSDSKKLVKASFTLNDCLACSGCITSAESVLIGQQNGIEFLKLFQEVKTNSESRKYDKIAVALSVQPILSFAVKFNITPLEARAKLASFFRNLGASIIVDVDSVCDLNLMECGMEFVERAKKNSCNNKSNPLPILASACPGFICYAEKTHGDWILPFVSEIKSPQQIAGRMIKDCIPPKIQTSAARLAVVMLMPCFDKKLEASRSDFFNEEDQSKDVDMVITPVEIEEVLEHLQIRFGDLGVSEIDSLNCDASTEHEWTIPKGSGSGGYADHIFRFAAKELHGIFVENVNFFPVKNSDLREAVLERDGKVLLRVAIANGFRNIQNIVQKMKRNRCPYDYVEIMACPSGCLNGGAQFRPETISESKVLGLKIDSLHQSMKQGEAKHATAEKLAKIWLHESTKNSQLHQMLRTKYHAVPKTTSALLVKW